jgi:hypothetical protein
MRQADFRVFDLSSVRLIRQLQVEFVNLSCAGCPDWMTFGFEAAAGVNGHGPFEIWRTTLDILASLSRAAEPEILITNNLGYRKAVVEFGDVDVFWSDISHLVRLLRR